MLFNPCSPCCKQVLTDITYLQTFLNTANIATDTMLSSMTLSQLTPYSIIWIHIPSVYAFYVNSSTTTLRDWFNLGNKRLIIVPRGEYAIGGVNPTFFNSNESFYYNHVNTVFLPSISSTITIDFNTQLRTSNGCNLGSTNTHYLTNGISSVAFFDYEIICSCNAGNAMNDVRSAPNNINNGTSLVTYASGSAVSLEKINTSEIIIFNTLDALGDPSMGSTPTYCVTSPPPNLPPCFGVTWSGGCAYTTPQILLNLSSLAIQ